ncbi:MAG: TOBE domain-containing protein [Thermodesulfobacteriota bacterium]|nr:TOBE domain-containing protein [Thermodesulfobacteriota bacterium]
MADQKKTPQDQNFSPSSEKDHSRIISLAHTDPCLDTAQLNQLEQSFRKWATDSPRADVRFSRCRILITFLLTRYTGAKLKEVLAVNPFTDIDSQNHAVTYCSSGPETVVKPRKVYISEALCNEILKLIHTLEFIKKSGRLPDLDPGFVRRKFYERTAACGFGKEMGGPEAIRRARAIELMQGNLPLPAVQMILGHTSANLTSSYVTFSESEIQAVAKRFMEKESGRRTSARNAFFCKVTTIVKGDIQSLIEMTTLDGHPIITVITNDSVKRLGLVSGKWVTAEVKAPQVMLQSADVSCACSVENRFKGIVTRITRGKINTECIVTVSESMQICAVISSAGSWISGIKQGDQVRAFFTAISVVLHLD